MTVLALPLIVLFGLVQTPSPRDLVNRAVTAMGGDAAVRGVKAYSVTFYETSFGIGQEETPSSPPRPTVTIGQQVIDYAGNRSVATFESRNPAGTVNKVRRVTAGGIGLQEINSVPAAAGAGAVANVERFMRRAPERLLITALDNSSALRPLPSQTWRNEMVQGVRFAVGLDTLDLYFDPRTGLLVLTETLTDDPILGDRRTRTAYTRWQDAGGVLFARQIDVEVNGRLQTNTIWTAVSINAATSDTDYTIPDSIASRAPRSSPTPPPISVTLVELAPNVWRAEGGSHHSLIVDQGAGLVVIEAPQSAQRMEAVFDTLRSRFAGKPVSRVISTHHHWDHSGGLRTVLAANVPIVTHARNASFVRTIGTARKTVRPDALSRSGRPSRSTITTVEDSLVVGSGDTRVVAYRLPTAHVEGMLAIYVPAARILFQSDVVSANPNPPAAGSAELVKFVKARGIAVERVAGGHGLVVPWADVERVAAPPATAP